MDAIIWKYTKPLANKSSVEEFELTTAFNFPKAFVECITLNNGGFPSSNVFDTDKKKERTIQHLLSFNKSDKANIWTALDIIKADFDCVAIPYVPFALNDFGNYICFERSTKKLVFLNRENGEIEHIADSFEKFLNSLYVVK